MTAMLASGRHHPSRAVEHSAEVVVTAAFGLAGGDAHPHRQLESPLGSHSCVDGRPR